MKLVKYSYTYVQIVLIILNFINIVICKDFDLDYLVKTFDSKTHIYDLINKKTHKDLFRNKSSKVIKKMEENFQINSYIYLLPNTFNNNLIKNITEEYFNILNDNNKINLNDTIFITYFHYDKKFDFYIGNNLKNKIKNLDELEKLKNKIFYSKLLNKDYFLTIFNFLKMIYKNIKTDNNKKIMNAHTEHKGSVVHLRRISTYDQEKSNMIKSFILLPFIIIMCYHYFSGKSVFKENIKEIDLKKISIKKIEKKEILDKPCVICLEELIPKQTQTINASDTKLLIEKPLFKNKVMILECNHMFHPNCILKWLKKQKKCPTCRNEIENNNINLYQIV